MGFIASTNLRFAEYVLHQKHIQERTESRADLFRYPDMLEAL